MRLIDADKVVTIQVYDDMTEKYGTKKVTIADAIDEWSDEGCPETIDAEPVRHGKWISHGSYSTCSVCGEEQFGIDTGRYYCQNCGAKMNLKE